MNQLETAKKITAYLDKGTAQLKAGTAYKLQLARQAALATAGGQPQRSSELALAGGDLRITPPQLGREIDGGVTVARLLSATTLGDREVALSVRAVYPPLDASGFDD